MRAEMRAGFARRDAIAIVVLLAFLLGVIVPILSRDRMEARKMKDIEQLKSIMRGLNVFSSYEGKYPVASRLDLDNSTVAETLEEKNTTGSVFAILIANGQITPQMCVSPVEVSDQVRVCTAYEFPNPRTAARPDRALWDPAFRGTPLDADRVMGCAVNAGKIGKPSNQSYAHLIPLWQRSTRWEDTFSATIPVLSNRGPTFVKDDYGALSVGSAWTLDNGPLGSKSLTTEFFGKSPNWKGHVAYGDEHVNFERDASPAGVEYDPVWSGSRKPKQDNLFVNESDESEGSRGAWQVDLGVNAYLRPIWRVNKEGTIGVWRD